MNKNKPQEIAQTLGDASLVIRLQSIATGLMQGRFPSALQLMSVTRSILYRVPRIRRFLEARRLRAETVNRD